MRDGEREECCGRGDVPHATSWRHRGEAGKESACEECKSGSPCAAAYRIRSAWCVTCDET